jgi:hypothetical protein
LDLFYGAQPATLNIEFAAGTAVVSEAWLTLFPSDATAGDRDLATRECGDAFGI